MKRFMGSPCDEVLGNHSKGWLRGFYTLWAQRGYLGIHAEVPTAQCLRSASVVLRGVQIKI
ncbi:hypothetical protein [Pseudomonas sp. A-RE-23]|nr:hypothetical protein [Pseudomonas sp. A-RE-23]